MEKIAVVNSANPITTDSLRKCLTLFRDGGNDELSPVVLGLLDAFPLSCRIVAPDLSVIWQSPYLCEVTSAPSGGCCCESLGLEHTPEDCTSLRTLQTGKPQRRVCWIGAVYVELQTAALRNESGRVIGSLEFLRDITTEKKLSQAYAEQQDLLEMVNKAVIEANHHLENAGAQLEEKNATLERVNAQLKELDHMKDEFINIVSHELKAPLTSIQGSVDLILGKSGVVLDDTTRDLLLICQRNAHRLTRLVLDLLDVARLDSGMFSLDYSAFRPSGILRECVESLKPAAAQKGIEIKYEVSNDDAVEADKERITQVLMNLLSNAVKFTDNGSVTVEAAVDSERLSIAVTDTGCGIADQDIERVFDKFTQVSGVMSRKLGGTGLGLSIVRGIVRQHGGNVTVASRPGEGSTFSLWIPKRAVHSKAASAG